MTNTHKFPKKISLAEESEVIERIEGLAKEDGTTLSSWIRQAMRMRLRAEQPLQAA